MGTENSAGFNENLSKSSVLAEKFRKAEVVGQKTQEQNNVANVKVEEILSTSFPIHYQSKEQYNSIPQYKSVIEMVAVSNDSGKTEDVQNRAKSALFEVGLALSQNRQVLKAATEGSDELNKILPSNLHEIQPYILSVILTDGKDDVEGQELVVELVDLFKLKKKAETIHGKAEIDYNEKKDSFLDKLYDKSQEMVDEAALGRIETMMGYVMSIDNKTQKQSENNKRNNIQKSNENDDVYIDPREFSRKLENQEPKDILKFSKRLLDIIDNSPYESNDLAISSETTRILNNITDFLRLKIETNLDIEKTREYKKIFREIDSRLALHDSAFYMSNSGFKITEHGGIVGALDKISERGRSLDKDRLKFLLKDSIDNGLPIPDAWDYMQKANFDYKNLLREVAIDLGYIEGSDQWQKLFNKIDKIGEPYSKGTTVENLNTGYWLDTNDERKVKVDSYIIKQISKTKEMDGAKALQLSKKLIEATGERSVFNFALVNGDDFAEDIHFAYYRADDARKGKNVGPMSTMGIQTLTPGWLRTMSKWDTNSGREINTALKASDIDFENNEQKNTCDYYYRQILAAKIHPLRSALVDGSPDPKKIVVSGAAYFNSIVDCFSKAEPSLNLVNIPSKGYVEIQERSKKEIDQGKSKYYVEGIGDLGKEVYDKSTDTIRFLYNGSEFRSEKSREGRNNLRSMYALGLLELIATKPGLGWTPDQIMELRKIMVETNLSTAKPFLNEKMWDWVNQQTIANDGSKNYNFKEALIYNRKMTSRQSFWKGFLKGISGQK